MSLQAHFYNLTDYVRDLLCCDDVCLFLGCPDPVLRHPLLASLIGSATSLTRCYSAHAHPDCVYTERVNALCDISLQTGIAWSIDCVEPQIYAGLHATGTIIAAPLERPSGILGLLLLTNIHPHAFHNGEYRLLEQYLPTITCQIEDALAQYWRASCASALTEEAGGEKPSSLTDVQEQSEFIAMVSHDLRIPLSAIKGYIGLLQAYGLPDTQDGSETVEMTAARQRQYLSAMMEQSDHLEMLIGELLDISRMHAGRLIVHVKKIELAPLCQSVARLMQYRVERQEPGRYAIRCTVDPALPPVWADPARVQQVLTNLLENAVKYSPDGGLIEILVHSQHPLSSSACYPVQSASNVYVTIRDRGIGIPYQQQSSLFKPFKRLEHASTRGISGTGLGLYISRKLVEAMAGNVLLRSREGQGTSVTFSLPTVPTELPGEVCSLVVSSQQR